MCDRKLGLYFFLSCVLATPETSSRIMTPHLAYTIGEYTFCLGLRPFDFCWILTICVFSLRLTDSVAREFQKIQRDCSFFNLLHVASLRFSLVFLCVQFAFSASALHFLVRWISRLIALWSQGDVTKTGNGERGAGNGSLGTSCQRKPP